MFCEKCGKIGTTKDTGKILLFQKLVKFWVNRRFFVGCDPSIKVQKRWIKKITQEISIIEGNKMLIEIYNQKIEDRISEVWGK